MKLLILLLLSVTATAQDTTNIRTNSGNIDLRQSLQWMLVNINKINRTLDTSRTNIYSELNTRQTSGSYLASNGNGSSLTGITPTQIGLGSVDNTSDASKPVSTATQTALNLKANITSPTLVTPNIGAATGTSLGVTGTLGFATGAGGTVSQNANKGTAVTLNKSSGQITMVNSALAAAAEVSFTLNNSVIAANDVVFVSIKSGGTVGAYLVSVTATGAGSCSITLSNASAGSLSEAVVLNFVVIKGSAS